MDIRQKLHPIMFAGTGSDVGKSIIAAAFCRIFLQDGYAPAPFKAQNMALNSYATPDGLEIGRAQAMQAEAARTACHTDMNPLLLKPCTDQMAQVVLNGKVWGNKDAYDYFNPVGRDLLRQEVHRAFDRLSARYNPIVMEGAGSISEINLKETDLVNMPMALYAGADVVLVADIDRGGVFASVYGSVMLLNEEERKHLKGIIINKFRGDLRLFETGVEMLEALCHVPVLGVIPYLPDICIDQEDSLVLSGKNRSAVAGKVNVAVVLLRYLANFTDFNVLEQDGRVQLYYARYPEELSDADVVILPGTKSTLSDLLELRRTGMAQAIVSAARNGKTVLGICGGYQMLGQEITDPDGVESDIRCLPGLGLLPVSTVLRGEKVTRQQQFTFLGNNTPCAGYEIHMGDTRFLSENLSPMNRCREGRTEGCLASERCMGTYMHGILDNEGFRDYLLAPYLLDAERARFDYAAFKEAQYDKLADHVRRHVDMDKIYGFLIER